MIASTTAENDPIVSRDRVIAALRAELRTVVIVQRLMSVEQIAAASGIKARAVRTYMSNEPTEAREPCLSAALSLAVVLGPRCLNAVLALIGYVASPLEDADAINPMTIAADGMAQLAVIAQAAADGRIDHTEMPRTMQAADMLIATVLPLSSAGQAS